MNYRNKALPVFLVFVCASVPALVGRLFNWPAWVGIFLALTMAAGLGLLVVRQSPRHSPVAEPLSEPLYIRPNPPAEPLQETHVDGLTLPSALPDYDFVFSATVRWRPTRSHPDLPHASLGNLAVSAVLKRAQLITSQEHPYHWDAARYRLVGSLGAEAADASGLFTALATNATLTLNQSDRDRLEKLARLRKTEDAWEQHQQYERNRRSYIGEEVLKSPGSAVVWWLTRHEDEVEKAVEMIGPLAQLSAAANDTEVPEPFRRLVAGFPTCESTPAPGIPGYGSGGPECSAEERDGETIPVDSVAPSLVDPDSTVVERVRELLEELGLEEGSVEREVLVHRIARSTDASGRVVAAERIRQHLSGRWAGETWLEEEASAATHPARDKPEQPKTDSRLADSGGTGPDPRVGYQDRPHLDDRVGQASDADRIGGPNIADDYHDTTSVIWGTSSRRGATNESRPSPDSGSSVGEDPLARG
ncbi:hypothetical protein [Kitasatospora sp. NPDC087271]|uniref:hypothetical protein n=1 Tax=Kitasatospora sp. NPDC087271 TaxID=3364067 RepID=UPI003802F710